MKLQLKKTITVSLKSIQTKFLAFITGDKQLTHGPTRSAALKGKSTLNTLLRASSSASTGSMIYLIMSFINMSVCFHWFHITHNALQLPYCLFCSGIRPIFHLYLKRVMQRSFTALNQPASSSIYSA